VINSNEKKKKKKKKKNSCIMHNNIYHNYSHVKTKQVIRTHTRQEQTQKRICRRETGRARFTYGTVLQTETHDTRT